MGIDWSAVVTSGLVSAIVSGVISVLLSRYVAGRQEEGKLAAAARKQIREVVDPILTEARFYKSSRVDQTPPSSRSKADEEKSDRFDVESCAKVLMASRDLPLFQRNLVKRRLRKLYGPKTVTLCDVESVYAVNPDETDLAIARWQLHHSKDWTGNAERLPDRGLLERARGSAPTSREISRLLRSLERLRRGH
jgi:hypothetical protein